ncbi:MAG: NAD(P)-dependent oxidoreductase [Myxococcota bacterium]
MARIGFLGLGAMGSRMAAHLLNGGHDLVVYNRSDAPAEALVRQGAIRAATPQEAAKDAECVITMVTDDPVSRSLWLEGEAAAIHGLSAGTVVVESSTVTASWVQELAEAVEAKGAHCVDAPVIGSRPQAEAQQLVYVVGAEPLVLERVQPILSLMGGAVHHVGPLGHGAAMKLAVNAMFASQVELLGEVLGMLQRAGIQPVTAMEILGQLPVTSPAAKGVGALIVADKTDPLFPVDLVAKDLRYAVSSAAPDHAPALSAVQRSYEWAQEEGLGDRNINAVAKLFVKPS